LQLIHFRKIHKSLFIFILALLQIHGYSQRSIQVNSIDEFTLRDQQMLNGWSPFTSFTVRPLFVADSSKVMKLLVGINHVPKLKKGNIAFYAFHLGKKQWIFSFRKGASTKNKYWF
jgi:hypothetical protein